MISKSVFLARAFGASVVLIALLSAGKIHASNVLTNSGFEANSFSGWTKSGPNNYVGFGPVHGGNYSFKVYQAFNGQTNFTGIYQDKVSSPGAAYSADGWGYTYSGDVLNGKNIAWVEVTFRDASKNNVLALYRSLLVTTNAITAGIFPKNTWIDLAVTNQYDPGSLQITNTATSLVAPSGTAYVRYQIIFQGDPLNSGGSMYFDDLTLDDGAAGAPPPSATNNWNIVWSDEFNGSAVNTNIWIFETGNNGGWGNSELEYYTGRTNNAYVSNGLLHIVALQESTNGFSYTSARMKTLGLYATPTYGRIEWRARTPAGVGMWPALWMMGTNFPVVGWPNCGEIDVVENNGSDPTFVQGSLHPNGDPTAISSFTGGDSITNFHTYLLDWATNSIRWLVDGQVYEAQSTQTPFKAPFFFLMNLAVGGQYVGYPTIAQINAGTVFPAEMQVDYVRVYEQTAPLQISATLNNGNVVLTWPSNIVCHLQAQTNSLTGGSWSDASNAPNPLVMAPDPGNASVFYRLESP